MARLPFLGVLHIAKNRAAPKTLWGKIEAADDEAKIFSPDGRHIRPNTRRKG